MSFPSSPLFSLGFALLMMSTAEAITLDGLISNSPFIANSTVGTQPTNPESTSIEFRGVISSRDGTVFGLYDRTRNQGEWVRQNEKGADFTVLDYDEVNAVVTVEYQGQKLSLALSSSKIDPAVPYANPRITSAPMGAPPVPGLAGATSTDQRKLESIAAEVRRRRALRSTAPAVTPPQP